MSCVSSVGVKVPCFPKRVLICDNRSVYLFFIFSIIWIDPEVFVFPHCHLPHSTASLQQAIGKRIHLFKYITP